MVTEEFRSVSLFEKYRKNIDSLFPISYRFTRVQLLGSKHIFIDTRASPVLMYDREIVKPSLTALFFHEKECMFKQMKVRVLNVL